MSSLASIQQEGQTSAAGISTEAQVTESAVIGSTIGAETSAASLMSGQPVRGPATALASPSTTPTSLIGGSPSQAGNGAPSVASPPAPKGADGISNDDTIRAKFASSPGYVVPAPSFSYSVFPRVNSAPGSAQQSLPTPAVKITPPLPAAALQPPVPMQAPGMRPSFSYSIVSHANASSATGQQFQPATASQANWQAEAVTQSGPTPSLQTSDPGKSLVSSFSVPGIDKQTLPNPMQLPFPAPKGSLPTPASFSFGGSSQPATSDSQQKNISSNLSTSGVAAEPVHAPSLSGTIGPPGPPALPSSTSPSSTVTVGPAVTVSAPAPVQPIMSSPAALSSNSGSVPAPVPQNAQQHIYPPYPSIPVVAPPPQSLWLHPPHAGGLQRPPFIPYPGAFHTSFPLPMQGLPPPFVPPPGIRPPGVFPFVAPGGTQSVSTGSGQPVGNLGAQSPPPGIDHGQQANDLKKVDTGIAKQEDSDSWTAHKAETGAIYYYNSITAESTYERPSSFKGEPDKGIIQPTPVSWEKLAGTDWALVTTNDGKKYYYNTKNKVSSWQVPTEVAEQRRNQENDSSKSVANMSQSSSMVVDKVSTHVGLNSPAIQTGGRDAMTLKTPAALVSSSALDLIKKKLQDAGTPITSSPIPASVPTSSDSNGPGAVEAAVKGQQNENNKDKSKDGKGDENLSESSSDSDEEEGGPSKEECIIQFKEMLKERGIAPFSKWEKELPKIVFDPRFKAVQSHSVRRSLFEHYVRTRAEEQRKEKRAAQKAAIEGFKQLLEEASEDIDQKTDYQTFKRKWGRDPRFEAVDRKERELLLSERVLSLKKAAEEKARAIRSVAVSSFKSMLREKGDITITTRWSRVKDSLRDDPRYKSVRHEDRELFFNEYVSELKAAENEAELAAKAKREEQEKLKKREQEMRKRKQREEQEMETLRLKVRRKEAESSYQALLVETIKDPMASWTESKPKLEKDPQGRATNPDLDPVDMEKLFREHVKDLYERCARDYRTLLAEVITAEAAARVTDDGKTILTSWSEAKRLLKADPRYAKMTRKERESLWSRYSEEMLRKQKSASDPKERPDAEGKKRSATDVGGRSPKRYHSRR